MITSATKLHNLGSNFLKIYHNNSSWYIAIAKEKTFFFDGDLRDCDIFNKK
jgi:hypothetical protein